MESTVLQAAKLLNQMAKDMPGPIFFIFRYFEKLDLCLFCDRSCSVFCGPRFSILLMLYQTMVCTLRTKIYQDCQQQLIENSR